MLSENQTVIKPRNQPSKSCCFRVNLPEMNSYIFPNFINKATQCSKTSNTGTLVEVPDISCLLTMSIKL